jgi:ectoine hydroxylase
MRTLSQAEIAQYHNDGYVLLPGFFTAEEIEPLRRSCLDDPSIGDALMAIADSAGEAQEWVLYTELSDDLVGVIPRVERAVAGAEALLDGPSYHWHSKLSMKQPGSKGTWDWHQDYGYWYHQAVLRPAMLTLAIAVDQNTIENGCMSVIKGSHKLGRIEHSRKGEASGANQTRIDQALKKMEKVTCTLEPGDAVYFHCNVLHASGPNLSIAPRTILHCSYNAADNAPFLPGQEAHGYSPLEKLPDSAITDGAWDTVFDNQIFITTDGDASYGYKTLRRGTRAKNQTPRMAVSRAL